MVESSFLLCDQLSGFNLHCSCASAGLYLLFHAIKLVVITCTTMSNDVYFSARYYVKLSIAVERRLSVRLSVTLLYSLYCGRLC